MAVVGRLTGEIGGDVSVDVLSTYPTADRASLARAEALDEAPRRVTAVPCTPRQLVVRSVPLGILAGALRAARLPWRWLATWDPALHAIADADVVADISGISYSDSRPVRYTLKQRQNADGSHELWGMADADFGAAAVSLKKAR